jgi:site-specific recombinase XerD
LAELRHGVASRSRILRRHASGIYAWQPGITGNRVQVLLGHRNVNTTVRYAQVATSDTGGTPSPLDRLRLELTPPS